MGFAEFACDGGNGWGGGVGHVQDRWNVLGILSRGGSPTRPIIPKPPTNLHGIFAYNWDKNVLKIYDQ